MSDLEGQLERTGVSGMRALLESGAVTARGLAEASFRQVDALDDRVNAIIAHGLDRGRQTSRLYAGSHECTANGGRRNRKWTAPILCPRAYAAHDKYLHAER